MKILDWLFRRGPRLTPAPEDDFWYEPVPAANAANAKVTPATAMNNAAYYRAIAVLAGSESTLPVHVFRRVSDSERERVSDHEVERLFNNQPNDEMDSQCYREVQQAHVLNWGNSYSEVVHRFDGGVAALWPLSPDPNWTQPFRDRETGRIRYHVRRSDNTVDELSQESVLHVKNLGPDGLLGWSVPRIAAQALGIALGQEAHVGSLVADGMRPAGMLKHPGKPSQEAVERTREDWEKMLRLRRLGILYGGLDWVKQGTEPEAAQLLESRKFGVIEVARFTGVSPHLLFDFEKANYNSLEQLGLEFLIFTLRYWNVKWDRAIRRTLLASDDQLYVEHNTDALLRADIKARYEAYKTAREGGWMSINDVRRKENEPGIGPEGDRYITEPPGITGRGGSPPKGPADPAEKPAEDAEPMSVLLHSRAAGFIPAVRSAHQRLLADTLARMIRKECSAIAQAANRGQSRDQWLAWIDRYYAHHRGLVQQAIEPALAAWLAVLGSPTDAAELAGQVADRHVTDSSRELLDVLDGNDTEQGPFLDRLTVTLAQWTDERAAAIAETVIGGTKNESHAAAA